MSRRLKGGNDEAAQVAYLKQKIDDTGDPSLATTAGIPAASKTPMACCVSLRSTRHVMLDTVPEWAPPSLPPTPWASVFKLQSLRDEWACSQTVCGRPLGGDVRMGHCSEGALGRVKTDRGQRES